MQQQPLPERLVCSACKGLARDAFIMSCCEQNICKDCREKINDKCPICDFTPLENDSIKPNENLRTTVQVYLRLAEKRSEEQRQRSGKFSKSGNQRNVQAPNFMQQGANASRSTAANGQTPMMAGFQPNFMFPPPAAAAAMPFFPFAAAMMQMQQNNPQGFPFPFMNQQAALNDSAKPAQKYSDGFRSPERSDMEPSKDRETGYTDAVNRAQQDTADEIHDKEPQEVNDPINNEKKDADAMETAPFEQYKTTALADETVPTAEIEDDGPPPPSAPRALLQRNHGRDLDPRNEQERSERSDRYNYREDRRHKGESYSYRQSLSPESRSERPQRRRPEIERRSERLSDDFDYDKRYDRYHDEETEREHARHHVERDGFTLARADARADIEPYRSGLREDSDSYRSRRPVNDREYDDERYKGKYRDSYREPSDSIRYADRLSPSAKWAEEGFERRRDARDRRSRYEGQDKHDSYDRDFATYRPRSDRDDRRRRERQDDMRDSERETGRKSIDRENDRDTSSRSLSDRISEKESASKRSEKSFRLDERLEELDHHNDRSTGKDRVRESDRSRESGRRESRSERDSRRSGRRYDKESLDSIESSSRKSRDATQRDGKFSSDRVNETVKKGDGTTEDETLSTSTMSRRRERRGRKATSGFKEARSDRPDLEDLTISRIRGVSDDPNHRKRDSRGRDIRIDNEENVERALENGDVVDYGDEEEDDANDENIAFNSEDGEEDDAAPADGSVKKRRRRGGDKERRKRRRRGGRGRNRKRQRERDSGQQSKGAIESSSEGLTMKDGRKRKIVYE